MNRFRALYLATVAVVGIGISGSVIVPRAQADYTAAHATSSVAAAAPLDVRFEAGRYVWRNASALVRSRSHLASTVVATQTNQPEQLSPVTWMAPHSGFSLLNGNDLTADLNLFNR